MPTHETVHKPFNVARYSLLCLFEIVPICCWIVKTSNSVKSGRGVIDPAGLGGNCVERISLDAGETGADGKNLGIHSGLSSGRF